MILSDNARYTNMMIILIPTIEIIALPIELEALLVSLAPKLILIYEQHPSPIITAKAKAKIVKG